MSAGDDDERTTGYCCGCDMLLRAEEPTGVVVELIILAGGVVGVLERGPVIRRSAMSFVWGGILGISEIIHHHHHDNKPNGSSCRARSVDR